MIKLSRLCTIALTVALLIGASSHPTPAQTLRAASLQASDGSNTGGDILFSNLPALARANHRGISLMPANRYINGSDAVFNLTSTTAAAATVTGSGTPGRLSKWAGVSGSSTFVLGDSFIFEDKFGKVGIGTDTPTSKLTVAGGIESTTGGFKFPDGSVQTSSATGALFSVAHDATLTGNGTALSPLGIAAPPGEPFQRQVSVSTPNGGRDGTATIIVPGNKRLLIEFASIRVTGFSPTKQPDRMEITTSVGGESATYQLGFVRTVLSGGINTHIASQQVVIWADPGTTMTLAIDFPEAAAGFTTTFAIAGRLFDALN